MGINGAQREVLQADLESDSLVGNLDTTIPL